jgi:hypothetical protein
LTSLNPKKWHSLSWALSGALGKAELLGPRGHTGGWSQRDVFTAWPIGIQVYECFRSKNCRKKREHMESSPREKGSYHGRSLSETNIVTGKGYVQHWKAKYL